MATSRGSPYSVGGERSLYKALKFHTFSNNLSRRAELALVVLLFVTVQLLDVL